MEYFFDAHHGVVKRAQLAALGYTRSEIQRSLRTGRLRRLRPGWYATESADPQVARAASAGGALTCLSALAMAAIWVPKNGRLHVRRTAHLDQRPLPPGVVCCRPYRQAPVGRSVDPLIVSLAAAMNSHDTETAVVLLDSALHTRQLDQEARGGLNDLISGTQAGLFDLVDPEAESGTETLTRLRLRRRNIKLRSQVTIDGVGRVDFLAGDRFVLEIDGWEYHADRITFINDRRRDRRLVALGYVVMRLTYTDVVARWPQIEADILAVIRAGAHRWPRRRSAGQLFYPEDRPCG